MPRLTLLNGPPGIGKSTVASRYVSARPGILNLDIDLVRTLVGGWRADFVATGEIVRPIAVEMARAHLTGGRDVIVPQYLAATPEVRILEAVSAECGSDFLEVVLLDDRASSVDRFARRLSHAPRDRESWTGIVDQVAAEVVQTAGGRNRLEQMFDELVKGVEERPSAVLLRSSAGEPEVTLRLLTTVLEGSRVSDPPG